MQDGICSLKECRNHGHDLPFTHLLPSSLFRHLLQFIDHRPRGTAATDEHENLSPVAVEIRLWPAPWM